LGLSACAGFERGAWLAVDHDGTPGLRGTLGMPKGRRKIISTEAAFAIDTDGFFAVAGGASLRAQTGWTPRLGAAFGVAAAGQIAATCEVVAEREECKNGIGPYGEADLGFDAPIAPGLALSFTVGGNLYLNGEDLEQRARVMLGVVWK
jgi:hypothetical protein